MLERYGDEIQSDLFEIAGWDLLDYFRGVRPWDQLTALVDRLPAWSHTGRAMADDDDLQREREKRQGVDTAQRGPRWSHWTLAEELLATLNDVGDAIRVTVAQSTIPRGKPRPTFKPRTRPKTAAERSEKRQERETIADIVALALPPGREK